MDYVMSRTSNMPRARHSFSTAKTAVVLFVRGELRYPWHSRLGGGPSLGPTGANPVNGLASMLRDRERYESESWPAF